MIDTEEPELELGPSAAHVARTTAASVATIMVLIVAVGALVIALATWLIPNPHHCDQASEAAAARSRAESGDDLDERSFCRDDTAVLLAIRSGDDRLLEDLLDAGASPNIPTKPAEHRDIPSESGEPPIWFAARVGNDVAIRLLLEAGADADALHTEVLDSFYVSSPISWTLLVRSTYKADIAAVDVLLDGGADPAIVVDVPVPLARNVLSVVAPGGAGPRAAPEAGRATEPLDRLLAGTEPIAVDALTAAAAQHASFAALERVGDELPPQSRATTAWERISERLLEHGAPVDGGPGAQVTPLYLAARYGDEQMVRLLLEAGADPTIAVDGWIPLDAARYGGWSKVIALLED